MRRSLRVSLSHGRSEHRASAVEQTGVGNAGSQVRPGHRLLGTDLLAEGLTPFVVRLFPEALP